MITMIIKYMAIFPMFRAMQNWIEKCRKSKLVHNTGWMFTGQGLSLLIQAAYFVIIARSLGTREYGAFVAVSAFTQILAPFVGLGGGSILIKNVARNREVFPQYWGNLLFMTLVSGTVASLSLIAFVRLFFPQSIPLAVIVLISVADLVFSKVTDAATMAFQAIERLDVVAKLRISTTLARLLGIAILAAILHHPLAMHWSAVYLLTTIIGATMGLVWVRLHFGKACLRFDPTKVELTQGLYFSTYLASYNINNDIDKVMLARLSTLDAVAIYAAAYRLVSVSFTPVSSLLAAAYPGVFRSGTTGLAGSYTYARRYLPSALLLGGIASLALFAGAPYVQYVLGGEFRDTTAALRWLAPLPLLKSAQILLADALTGAGFQGLRTALQLGVAILNILVNLWIIPRYSWQGAAWSSLLCDGTLVVGVWILCRVLQRRDLHAVRTETSSNALSSQPLSEKSAISL